MEAFARPEQWQNFYVMMGTSSAALVGLFFIAASLHLADFMKDPILRLRARNNAMIFVVVFLQCGAMLTPQHRAALGGELIALNLFALHYPVLTVFRMRRRGVPLPLVRMSFFALASVLGTAGGFGLIVHYLWSLHLIAVSNMIYFVVTVANAWALMLGVWQTDERISN
jgi:hypothetical protein